MGATPEQQLEYAKNILRNQGYAFRIYGRKDVEKSLDLYAADEEIPLDTTTHREKIVAHVMNGDDWKDMSKKGYDDEDTLFQIINGTHNDHPEWFPLA